MVSDNYFLLFKTAQAEFRAWNNLKVKDSIFPIIELTRGQKKRGSGKGLDEKELATSLDIYEFGKNVITSKEAFKYVPRAIIDLTREESLQCKELTDLAVSDNGYKKWVDFVLKYKEGFNDLIPTIIINPSEDETEISYTRNIISQFESLIASSSGVSYRASMIDPEFLYDLHILKDKINASIEEGKDFFVILDHEFIRPGTGMIHAAQTISIINKIKELIPNAKIVILSTSFPKSISEIGNLENDVFTMEEVFLFEEIKKHLPENNIYYGDYGSINPVRNDQSGGVGWVPRIDFPTSFKKTVYYREKRNIIGKTVGKDGKDKNLYSSYENHYINVAKKLTNDKSFIRDVGSFDEIKNSWGVEQIKNAVHKPAKTPSFWISVRMEIHILQQLIRLGLILKK